MDINLVIAKMFDGGKKLSIKNIKKHTGLHHKVIKKVIYTMMQDGVLRRINPREVGSNKYYSRSCPTDKEWIKYGKEVKTNNNGKEVLVSKIPKKERRNIHITMMNEKKLEVFARV